MSHQRDEMGVSGVKGDCGNGGGYAEKAVALGVAEGRQPHFRDLHEMELTMVYARVPVHM